MELPDQLDVAFLSVEEQRAVEVFRRQGRLPQSVWEGPVADARTRYDGGGVDALTEVDNRYLFTFHTLMGLGIFDGFDESLSD